MINPGDEHSFLRRHASTLALVVVIILSALLYVADSPNNPPGFYIDESSISYNALLIARTGHDEYGKPWPLYFRAFGDYKNPTYIYLLSLIVLQGAYFQWHFHKTAAERWYVFDARFERKVLAAALALGKRPIYVVDRPGTPGYIQVYWYVVLRGLDTSQFVHLPTGKSPPPVALVISTEDDCENCRLIAKSINYIVYAILPFESSVEVAELPSGAFRTHIAARDLPPTLKVGSKATLNVLVKNLGAATWPAVGESECPPRRRPAQPLVEVRRNTAHRSGRREPLSLRP